MALALGQAVEPDDLPWHHERVRTNAPFPYGPRDDVRAATFSGPMAGSVELAGDWEPREDQACHETDRQIA
jgi:hypothetical protein